MARIRGVLVHAENVNPLINAAARTDLARAS
jgi:hypothetical protein